MDGLLNPDFHYYSIWDYGHQLIGYCCFGEDARVLGGDYSEDALDIGGGLRPDLTGQGMGAPFIKFVLKFAITRFSPQSFRTTLAGFNLQAIKVCEKIGCVYSGRFFNPQLDQSFEILTKTFIRDQQQKRYSSRV